MRTGRFCLIMSAILLGLVLGSEDCRAGDPATGKIVTFGGFSSSVAPSGTISPVGIQDNLAALIALPFDGIVFDPSTSGYLSAYALDRDRTPTWPTQQFIDGASIMQSLSLGHLTNNYAQLNTDGIRDDWFDDVAWSEITNRCGKFAAAAYACGAVGICLDTEQYPSTPAYPDNPYDLFDYHDQQNYPGVSYANYNNKARERGAQMMTAIRTNFPGVKLLLTYGPSYITTVSAPPPDSGMGLLIGFFDGLLQESEGCTITDGFEDGYSNKTYGDFASGLKQIRDAAAILSADPELYRQRTRVSFGLWPWQPLPLTPAEISASLRFMLRVGDGVAWIYGAGIDWLTAPQEYIQAIRDVRTEYFVSPSGGNIAPYTNWTMAATSIQTAIDAAADGATVWVSNGVYTSSANEVMNMTKSLVVKSVNGFGTTVIDGQDVRKGIRIEAYTANSGFGVADGFTVTNCFGGAAVYVYGGAARNCLIAGNHGKHDTVHPEWGGAAFLFPNSFLQNSIVVGNSSYCCPGVCAQWGGVIENCLILDNGVVGDYYGAVSITCGSTVRNCTIVGNKAYTASGIYIPVEEVPSGLSSAVRNCIVRGNMYATDIVNNNPLAIVDHGNVQSIGGTVGYGDGTGNINVDPLFRNAAAGDYRLTLASPCIDAGLVTTYPENDFDGNSRPLDGNGDGVTVHDMGAYEYNHLTCRWNFDGNTNDTAPYGITNFAKLKSGMSYSSTDKKVGSLALSFSALSKQYASVTSQDDLNPTGPFTLCAWIKATDWNGSRRILQKGADGTQYRLYHSSSASKLSFVLKTSAGTFNVLTNPPPIGEWHHIAATYDGTTIKLYVDGGEPGSAAASGTGSIDAGPLYIGAKSASDWMSGDFWNGLIDDVRVYNGRALSQDEIRTVMTVEQ
ncbi:MAG: choice-of-anchor Q domain-containing protein [Kiritimatiellae bacterium]|nr:choice-of-anchor Q domain-containing protein [Kiritimatiellia bacterium]